MPEERLLVKLFDGKDAQYLKISVYYHRGDFINKGDAV